MRADCIRKVAAAAGKALSQAKIKAIDDAMSGKMRDLARQDPQAWASKSADQRATEAAQAVMQDIQTEAARAEYLGTLQLLKTAETNGRIAEAKQASAMDLTQSQALIRDIQNTHNYTHALHDEAVSTLGDMLTAASSKDGTGILRNLAMRIWDMDNPQMTADVVREVFKGADGHTGNKAAQAGARAWLDTIESLRLRFNAAGGDVGKLAYGYLSQAHDAVKIQAVSAADWARKVAPLLDRRQYLREDGSIMPDAELIPMLEGVHGTLASNGLNKVEPGQYKGIGKRANAGSDRRVLHFQDGDAWMAYMKDFGEGSLYDAMIGHVGHMTRNIGLVERMGPNPEMQFKLQADIAQRADGVGTAANRSLGNTPEAYWAIASGKTGSPENATIGKYAQDARNVQTAAKLGGAIVSSFTDVGTIAATLHYDRLPYFAMLKNIGRNFGKDHRAFLQAHGIIAENLTSTLNRWTGDNMTHSLTGRVANSVMKLSLMNAWTDGLRSAFSATMMQGFAKKTGTAWGKLDEWDRWLMTRKGITEEDWNLISQAKPTERDGVQYLTRDSIMSVSDADAAKIIPGRLDAISQRIKDQVKTLDDRNLQESGWIAARVDKVREAQDAGNRLIKKLAQTKEKKLAKYADEVQARVDLMNAQLDQAQVRAEIDAEVANLKSADEVRGMLADMAFAEVEGNTSAQMKILEGRADKSVTRVAGRGESVGFTLGQKTGSIKRRIIEAEQRVRNMDLSGEAYLSAKAKDEIKRIDAMRAELTEFAKASIDRQNRRIAVMNRLTAEEAPALAAEVLTRKQQAATKWMAFVSDEAQFAVVNPDMAVRAIVTGGGMPAGTLRGEALRTFMQFKSFPLAMLTRHWGRVFDTPQGLEGAPTGFGAQTGAGGTVNRMAVLAGLNVSLMVLGAVVLQTKSLLTGKDPYDMTEGKFWVKALGQGGGMGYVGDFLTKDPTEQRGSNFEQAGGVILGPTGGAVGGLVGDLMLTNAWESFKGKDTHAGAEALRWGNSQLPYVGLWQTRGAWEHWFLHNAQEAVNPGYLGRMRARAMKDWNQDYYWQPGEAVPDRAPDLSRAVGG